MNKKILTESERRVFQKLNTPQKIQNFINKIPNNFEVKGETCQSPRRVLKSRRAHCIEGAIFAAAALAFHKRPALVVHLHTAKGDYDHVVTIFKESGRFGAISKTNHLVLRFRDPVYLSIRELVMSYFHEYWGLKTGRKNLRSYTEPIDLIKKFGDSWIIEEKELWNINDFIFHAPHKQIVPKNLLKKLRDADKFELKMDEIVEWKK
jgi:hypothetical protein